MQHLPLELQLLVIENLSPKDILSLQLACKSFHSLVQASEEAIWKRCLKNQCRENELFAASFKDLCTTAQYKKACTTPWRLLKAYENALAKNKAIIPVRQVESKPILLTETSREAEISDIYLLPGGRFLLTFQQDQWLSVWDLHQARVDALPAYQRHDDAFKFKPDLLLRHTMAAFDSLAYIDSCVDGNTARILLKSRGPVPQGVTVTPTPDTTIHELPVFELLQLDMQDGNASIESLGRLTVVHPQIKHSTALSETQVFFLTDDVTMIWDASRNQASVWLTDGIPDICDVFTISNYAIYITSKGVYGVEIPPFTPLDRDWIVLPANVHQFDATPILRPSFFVPHKIKHSIQTTDQVSGPHICGPRFRGRDEEVFYEITEFEPLRAISGFRSAPKENDISVYRYLFTFNPAHPAQSTLKLTESAGLIKPPCTERLRPGEEVEFTPGPYQHSNRRLGCIWKQDIGNDEEYGWGSHSLYFSLSSPFEPPPAPMQIEAQALMGPRTRNRGRFTSNYASSFTKLGLVKFWDGPSVGRNRLTESVKACEFCPSTARVATLSEGRRGTWVTIFDLAVEL